jgi:AcrR family transcriptional regulator
MTLYGYFENRAAIIQAMRQRGFDQMDASWAEAGRQAEMGDALVQVRGLLDRFVRLSHEHPRLYQLVWRREASLPPDPQLVTRIVDRLSQLIRWGIERGQCVERDPALAAVIIFSSINGTLLLYHSVPALRQAQQA